MPYYNFFGQLLPTTSWSSRTIKGSAGLSTLEGSALDDNFLPNGSTVLSGGRGNDTYQFVTMGTKVIEAPGGGIDTVYVNSSYKMPDNIENLVVWYAPTAIGNSIGNIMVGSGAAETLDGAEGNDVLTGGGGSDIFQVSAKSGFDVITDFATSGASADKLRLTGYSNFTNFDQVKSAMKQVGSDVVLQLSSNDAVRFLNHKIADFGAEDFALGLSRTGMRATFADEFNGLSLWNGVSGAGTTGTWRTDYGWGATRDSLGSRQLATDAQVYIDPSMKGAGNSPIGISPFSINDGVLTIKASPTPESLKAALYNQNTVSGILTSRESFAQTYGYFEAKIDIPSGSGLWPAFWLAPANGSWPPEIDIMENYGGPTSTVTAHYGSRANHQTTGATYWDPTIAEGSHVWGLSWTPKELIWYLDDVEIYRTPTPAQMNVPMYLLINLGVQKGAAPTVSGEMMVDWVRAYQFDAMPAQTLKGSAGADTFFVSDARDTISEAASGGYDVVKAYSDYVLPDNIEKLMLLGQARIGTGNAANNVIDGNAQDNVLDGKAGADTLSGGAGNDSIFGGIGNDILIGGDGGDFLTGGSGADRFVFRPGQSTDAAFDTVYDFARSQGDKIDLSAIQVSLGSSVPKKLVFNGAVEKAGAVWFEQDIASGMTRIHADTDGNTATHELNIAFTGLQTFIAADFIL